MAESLEKKIQSMLTEEKWTRAMIANYSVNNFVELAEIIKEAREQDYENELKKICDEHLNHTKNSIIALYISGMISLKNRSLDNPALTALLDIFSDNKKTAIVIFLCDAVLAEDGNNKDALRKLADAYRESGDEKIWEIYERLVKVDHSEADVAKILAERYERECDLDSAVEYYKKAMLRYINAENGAPIKEIWSKLVEHIPEEISFFQLVQKKAAKLLSKERQSALLQELYASYKKKQKWDVAIDLLKQILSLEEKNSEARKEIVECYSAKYANHSHLEECIRISNLSQGWRNVFEAISDFEKHIAFDAKNYVYHRTWGVGRIVSIANDDIVVNFGKKGGERKMSLKMAVDALTPLKKNHIWVLKATQPREKLRDKVQNDREWALKTIIKSFDNKCDVKRIKAELVPAVLDEKEWSSWGAKARRELDENSIFGVLPEDISLYTVRDGDQKISADEKFFNEFKAQKSFFPRVDILMRFNNDETTDKTSESFAEMLQYFVQYLKSFAQFREKNSETPATAQVVASFLLIRKIIAENPLIKVDVNCNFSTLFEAAPAPEELYDELKDTKNTSLRRDFLECIRTLLSNWTEVYVRLFPVVLQKELLDALIADGHADKLKVLAQKAFENCRDRMYRNTAIFFFSESQGESWFRDANISYEKQLISLIHIMDVCYKEIAFHRDTTENKKICKKVQSLLFRDHLLLDYLLKNKDNLDVITHLYTLLDDIKDSEIEHEKLLIRNEIQKIQPNFKVVEGKEKIAAPKGMIVTAKMMDEKAKLLEQITKVDMPANAKEIAEAREQGDLKENAEYKAAREKQTQLNAQASRLQDEIERAIIFDPASISTVRISFGTKVTLLNEETKKDEIYTILGPWESNPEKGVISYMSPFGNAILNKKEGESFSFVINERKFSMTVKKIEAAKF